MNTPPSKRLEPQQYIEGILRGDRFVLARAITVIESQLQADDDPAAEILKGILPATGRSRRVGITGVPGAGKSTFIDTLGMHILYDRNETLAVLSVDPSSPFSRGSILGDKTRMNRLAVDERAFIRPSPASGHLGGVARRTRETILLCEAAGFQNILVETVGVGQSETAVRSMTDFFLLLILAGGGDELQGIKRGIIEMIDGMAINKADGENRSLAEAACREYANALHLLRTGVCGWTTPVVTVSGLTGQGIPELWETVLDHRKLLEESDGLGHLRQGQTLSWMRELVSRGLDDLFHSSADVAARLPSLEQAVVNGTTTAFAAAIEILSVFKSNPAS